MRASTGPTPVPGRTRRVVQDDPRPSFFTSSIDGAPRWAVGALTAVQAAALSLLALALPAIAVFVTTAADPANADVAWTRAVLVATHIWLLAHGVPAELGGAPVSAVPLGLTLLAVFTCYASARRSGVPARSSALASFGGYALLTALVALVAGAGGGQLLRALGGGLVVGVLGLGAGLLRRPEAPSWSRVVAPLRSRVPAAVTAGATGGVLTVAGLLAVAALLTASWVLAGHATVVDVVRSLSLDAVGGVVLAVAELAFVPNLVLWALAWIVGPGFAVGEGTRFATTEVVAGPLPAVPLLGALPDVAGGVAVVAPALVVGVGVLAGLVLRRGTGAWRVRDVGAALGALAVTVAVLVGVLVAVASGAVGPGRMAEVGADPLVVGLLTGVVSAAGAGAAAFPFGRALHLLREQVQDRRTGAASAAGTEGAASATGRAAEGAQGATPPGAQDR